MKHKKAGDHGLRLFICTMEYGFLEDHFPYDCVAVGCNSFHYIYA